MIKPLKLLSQFWGSHQNGEIAAVLINNEATLKTVKYVGDKTLLIPKNDAYDPLVLTPDNQNQVLGKVVSIIRDI